MVSNATEQGETVRTSTSTTETTAVTAVQVATPATAAATAVSRAATAPAAAALVDTTTAAATADSPITEGGGTVLPETTPSTTVDVPSDVETQVAPNDSEGPEEGEIVSDGYDTVSESSFTVREEQRNELPWSIAGFRRVHIHFVLKSLRAMRECKQ